MIKKTPQIKIGTFLWLCLLVPLTRAAEPITSAWIINPATNQPASLARIRPEVHSVNPTEKHIEIRSAGLSLYDLGALQAPNDHLERIRQLRFRIPRCPIPAKQSIGARPDVWGVFVNGVPIYNLFEATSYQEQNLWHFDPLAQRDNSHPINLGMLPNLIADGTRHSPLLGYAFDGYPIYGPWGFGAAGELRRMHSGYRLRHITRRTALANGIVLTPAQYGPPVNDEYPLGTFVEDYEFDSCLGDLDEFNGRFAVTPEYPQGTYAYVLSTDAQGRLAFPYLLTGQYAGRVTTDELRAAFRDEAAPPSDVEQAGILFYQDKDAALTIHGKQLAAHQPLRLSFAITNNGKSVRHLEYVHERPLHLLVVSEDLEDFAHIHPTLTAGDRYEVTHTFPRGGRYRLYADYTPPGSAQRITSFVLDLPDRRPASVVRAASPYHVQLAASSPLRANTEIEFALTIRDAQTNQAVTDLEPFLGAWAHFVIIDERHESFIHAHPIESTPRAASHTHDVASLGPPPETIRTLTSFPRAGKYKLWAQFQRNGTVITQPFVLRVAAAPTNTKPATVIPPDAFKLNVSAHGFAPAQLTVTPGKPFKLAVTRDQLPNCANKIVFPALGLSFNLPLGQTTVIELPALPAGELSFACGMGMYKGVLIAQ
ncbi:MAG: YHYH protein [Acidobacteria bacterium]|nr:YHYH protein [Acidobacteriota bacterium]